MGKGIKRKFVYIILGVVLIGLIIFNYPGSSINTTNQEAYTKELEAKFVVLSTANTNSCGGTFDYVNSKSPDQRIQGSCCGPMNFHRYTEQIKELKKYSKYKIIPPDPYDVSVSSAQELLDYQKNIILTDIQQTVYDKAVELSHEKGPCCCKCWHWYAYEGLAKYLIVEERFTAEQVADVWNISDACGGSGHSSDHS